MSWRNTRDYRIWRVRVIRRDKVCRLCGSRKERQAHHLDSGSYFPNRRFDPDNGVCLCRTCHLPMFHFLFMGGTRRKATKSHYERFMKLCRSAA